MDNLLCKYENYIDNEKPIPFIAEDLLEAKFNFIEMYNFKWLFIFFTTVVLTIETILTEEISNLLIIVLLCIFLILYLLYFYFRKHSLKVYIYNTYSPIILYNNRFNSIYNNFFVNEILKLKDKELKEILLKIINDINNRY